MEKRKPKNFQGKKIVLTSFLLLDIEFGTARKEILRNLAGQGNSTVLIAIRSKKSYKNKDLKINAIPIRYVPVVSPIIFAIILFFFLPFYIMISKPDFIITEPHISIFGFASAFLLSKFQKTRFVLDIRSTPVEVTGFRGFLQTSIFNASVNIAKRFFDGITIITPLMKKQVCKRFHIDPKFVGVWSSGVSTSRFNPDNYVSDRKELRRKLGLSEKFVVFYHGSFSPSRGLIETIEAVSIVKRAYPNVVFFLLGAGSIQGTLEEWIQKNGVRDNVSIHNSVDYPEVAKYIAMCDIGIVPLPDLSYWRFQCPVKLLEYLAMKKPVIVTDIPAHRVIIGNEECAIYVPSAKPTEIAKAIKYAYENQENLKIRGASGRTIVNSKFTWKKVARDLENYLLSIED